ncbi:MAG: hypothetical protein HN478_16805, partial [Rhodospirillaceae bacterium]|nr:hypothetical protein [Rhodospirillaceae bacterium]
MKTSIVALAAVLAVALVAGPATAGKSGKSGKSQKSEKSTKSQKRGQLQLRIEALEEALANIGPEQTVFNVDCAAGGTIT